MGAQANRAYLASVKETQWGVLPGTPTMQKVNMTAENMNYEIATTTPDTIRDDRQTSDVIQQSAGNAGGYEFEMQFGAHGPDPDQHLLGALWDMDWNGITAVDLNGAILTSLTKNFNTAGIASAPLTLVVGQKFRISGSSEGNDGVYTVSSVNGVDDFTLTENVAADETLGAGALGDGQYLRNGVTRHSFSLEQGHLDVDQYFLFTGMVVNEFNLAIEAGEVITGGYTFVGKDATLAQAANGDTYLDPVLNPFMSAAFDVQNVKLDGVAIAECWLMSLELNINNNVVGKLAVGSPGFCNTGEGEFELTGGISLYFNDETMYSKYLGNIPFSLEFDMADDDGNIYNIHLPKLKISEDVVDVEGKNTDVMDAAAYVALVDETLGYTIQITRIAKP